MGASKPHTTVSKRQPREKHAYFLRASARLTLSLTLTTSMLLPLASSAYADEATTPSPRVQPETQTTEPLPPTSQSTPPSTTESLPNTSDPQANTPAPSADKKAAPIPEATPQDGTSPEHEVATSTTSANPQPGDPSLPTRFHIITLTGADAIVLESQGRFGIVDSGEDDDYPDGSDPRYPSRTGITIGGGMQDRVITYLQNIGVTTENLEFYIGTHPHSDHIGSADEIISTFKPKRVYTPEYSDAFISDPAALYDNLYVYDHLIEAANTNGAALIQNLDETAPIVPEGFDATSDTSDKTALQTETSIDTFSAADAPASIEMTADEIERRFEANPIAQTDPRNPENLPGNTLSVPTTNDPNLVSDTTPKAATTGNSKFILGSMQVEIVNYGDDYKYQPKPDANYFCWGVKVAANGKTAFLSGDINNYDGDETRLAGNLGHIDLLKLGHHGITGSNTPQYLQTLSPTFAIQTADFHTLASSTIETLTNLNTSYWSTEYALSELGLDAVVADVKTNGALSLNTQDSPFSYFERQTTPYLTAYANGKPVVQNGWLWHNNAWYWFNSSATASENMWISDGSYWYYMGADGKMTTGAFTNGNAHYVADSSGRMLSNGWALANNTWYYLSSSGAAVTGWLSDGQSWYFLNTSTSAMATGWFSDGVRWYYANSSGRMQANQWISDNTHWYWLEANGAMATGWHSDGYSWYFLNYATGTMATGLFDDGSAWYGTDGSGRMLSNSWIADPSGSWHYAGGNGALISGWNFIGGSWYYFDPTSASHPAKTGVYSDGSESYYSDTDGRMLSHQWIQIPEGTYRYAGINGALRGFASLDASGTMTLLDQNGTPLSGWQSIGGVWFYAEPGTGYLATGLTSIDGTYYYFSSQHEMSSGWAQSSDGTWYLFASNGAMLTGWQYIDGAWYYLDVATGAMQTGWLSWGGFWYFLSSNGTMATGWKSIDGVLYYFADNGTMQSSDAVMASKAQSMSSDTSQLIMVDTTLNRVGIFVGFRGNWDLLYYWPCSPGAAATPTVQGPFTVGIKGYSFGDSTFTCYWYTQFYGDYLFHSGTYNPDGSLQDGRLGVNISHGCVRLDINNAKWIYDNIYTGTKVFVY